MGQIIDGKKIAASIHLEVKSELAKLLDETKIRPKLAVLLIGDNPGSAIYVRGKEKACAEVGILTDTLKFPDSVDEKTILALVDKLNHQKDTHGILIQLPLPAHLDARRILSAISVEKDVDGLHTENMGRLLKGENPLFYPCTPSGIMRLIFSTGVQVKGKEAVVVGRSNIVGKPVALMLLAEHATVTICHSRTVDLPGVCRRADILVAAVGQDRLVKGDWVKEGVVVIDVGMNRVGGKLFGDVDFDAVKQKAAFITPVPGGVGPMTIAMLLKNTLSSAQRLAGD